MKSKTPGLLATLILAGGGPAITGMGLIFALMGDMKFGWIIVRVGSLMFISWFCWYLLARPVGGNRSY